MSPVESAQRRVDCDPQAVMLQQASELEAEAFEQVKISRSTFDPEPAKKPAHQISFFRGLLKYSWRFFGIAAEASWWLFLSALRYFRYHPMHALSSGVLLTVVFILLVSASNLHDRVILSKISDDTISKIIDASRFTRNYQTTEAGQIGGQAFLGVGGPEWAQREGVRAILFQARRAGLSLTDQAILLATAEIESGFNPMAKAPTTTACGLFQFVRQTGIGFGLDPRTCMDPWANAEAGVKHYVANYERSVAAKVAELTGPERLFRQFELSYYLHHDGPYSSNPSVDVRATVLSGVQFLFRVYGELERESQSQKHAPSFAETVERDAWRVLSPLVSRLAGIAAPGLVGADAGIEEQTGEAKTTADQVQSDIRPITDVLAQFDSITGAAPAPTAAK